MGRVPAEENMKLWQLAVIALAVVLIIMAFKVWRSRSSQADYNAWQQRGGANPEFSDQTKVRR